MVMWHETILTAVVKWKELKKSLFIFCMNVWLSHRPDQNTSYASAIQMTDYKKPSGYLSGFNESAN